MSYWNFDDLITKKVIAWIYIIGAILLTFFSLILVFLSRTDYGMFLGILLVTIGNALWRVSCEMTIVAFKINENLEVLVKRLPPV